MKPDKETYMLVMNILLDIRTWCIRYGKQYWAENIYEIIRDMKGEVNGD